jgi:lysophospholipase L1-like esterase
MKIAANSKLLMIGDSITDCGRKRPVGEGFKDDALGNGYVALVAATLGATHPEARIRVVNMGISGNTARHMKLRWETDVLAKKPDWLSIMIGINDVWRQFDTPNDKAGHVHHDEYKATLEGLVANTSPKLKGLVLMTPYLIEPDRNDPMRARMDEYGEYVREIAARHKTFFVDTQSTFDRVLNTLAPTDLAEDRIHPNLIGHTILARAFLQAIGFEG